MLIQEEYVILSRLRVLSCQSDDVVIRLWQPLPPYVFNSEGARLLGNEQCYNKDDGDACLVPGCEVG